MRKLLRVPLTGMSHLQCACSFGMNRSAAIRVIEMSSVESVLEFPDLTVVLGTSACISWTKCETWPLGCSGGNSLSGGACVGVGGGWWAARVYKCETRGGERAEMEVVENQLFPFLGYLRLLEVISSFRNEKIAWMHTVQHQKMSVRPVTWQMGDLSICGKEIRCSSSYFLIFITFKLLFLWVIKESFKRTRNQ